jgi:hypothetical protein
MSSWGRATRRALTAEPEIGLLLPCNVIVYADSDGVTTISAIDPEAQFSLVQRADLADLARMSARGSGARSARYLWCSGCHTRHSEGMRERFEQLIRQNPGLPPMRNLHLR